MKTSTEIASIAKKVGMEKAVELCAVAGFDAWDFSMFDMHKLAGLPVPFGKQKTPLSSTVSQEFAQTHVH